MSASIGIYINAAILAIFRNMHSIKSTGNKSISDNAFKLLRRQGEKP